MIILQFFLVLAIFILGWICGVLITEEHRQLSPKKKKKSLILPTYGDESPEEAFRMMEEAKKFFWGHFKDEIEKILAHPARNWKAELQDYSQKKFQRPPLYKVLREEGPDHSKMFVIGAYLDNQEIGQGSGSSKKEAEQAAAENAIEKMRNK